MPEKLEKIIAAYEELEQKLMDPSVASDPKSTRAWLRSTPARPSSSRRPAST